MPVSQLSSARLNEPQFYGALTFDPAKMIDSPLVEGKKKRRYNAVYTPKPGQDIGSLDIKRDWLRDKDVEARQKIDQETVDAAEFVSAVLGHVGYAATQANGTFRGRIVEVPTPPEKSVVVDESPDNSEDYYQTFDIDGLPGPMVPYNPPSPSPPPYTCPLTVTYSFEEDKRARMQAFLLDNLSPEAGALVQADPYFKKMSSDDDLHKIFYGLCYHYFLKSMQTIHVYVDDWDYLDPWNIGDLNPKGDDASCYALLKAKIPRSIRATRGWQRPKDFWIHGRVPNEEWDRIVRKPSAETAVLTTEPVAETSAPATVQPPVGNTPSVTPPSEIVSGKASRAPVPLVLPRSEGDLLNLSSYTPSATSASILPAPAAQEAPPSVAATPTVAGASATPPNPLFVYNTYKMYSRMDRDGFLSTLAKMREGTPGLNVRLTAAELLDLPQSEEVQRFLRGSLEQLPEGTIINIGEVRLNR